MTFVLFASAAPPLQAAKDLANRLEAEEREQREIQDLIKQVNDKITGRNKAPEEMNPEKKREIEKAANQAIAYMKRSIPDYHRYGPISIASTKKIIMFDYYAPMGPGQPSNGAAHSLHCFIYYALGGRGRDGWDIDRENAVMKRVLIKARREGFKVEIERHNKVFCGITIHPPQP